MSTHRILTCVSASQPREKTLSLGSAASLILLAEVKSFGISPTTHMVKEDGKGWMKDPVRCGCRLKRLRACTAPCVHPDTPAIGARLCPEQAGRAGANPPAHRSRPLRAPSPGAAARCSLLCSNRIYSTKIFHNSGLHIHILLKNLIMLQLPVF